MAYTVLDIQTSVQDNLKDSGFSSSRILRYLNEAQRDIFNTHLFRFCEKSIVGDLTVGEYTYDQQADHQSTIGGVVVQDVTGSKFLLNKDTYLPHREFFEQYPDPSAETQGFPIAWTEFGTQVYFNCPADSTHSFTQRYYRSPATLTQTTDVPEVPESFREVLESFIMYRAEKYRGNHDIASTYRQAYEDGLEKMVMRYGPPTSVAPVQLRARRAHVS